MQDNDENMTDEQRALFEKQLQEADKASQSLVESYTDDEAQKLVDQYADDPDLKFVANPSLIGDGMNVIDNTESLDNSAMPQELTPEMMKRLKRMMAGPMSREKQPCKKCVSKEVRTKKRKAQRNARKANRR